MSFNPTKYLLLLLPFFHILQTHAFIRDTIPAKPDSSRVLFFTPAINQTESIDFRTADTSINHFQRYDPLLGKYPFHATTGNIGHAAQSLLLKEPMMSGFQFDPNPFRHWIYQDDDIRYYKHFKTFSQLSYFQGPKREQLFQALFSRKIFRSLTIGFDFRVMSAPGAYLRHKANNINFAATTHYFTRNNRYGVLFHFRYNRLISQENGGIKFDSLFDQNIEKNRQTIPVNLNKAKNRTRENGLFLKHLFRLSSHPSNDTARRIYSAGTISLTSRYVRNIRNYVDHEPASGFYPLIYYDSVRTFDSLRQETIENTLAWSNETRSGILGLTCGITQTFISVTGMYEDFQINQYTPFASLNMKPFRKLTLAANGRLVLGDYNDQDFDVGGKISYSLVFGKRNFGVIEISAQIGQSMPNYYFSHYHSNHFQWDTNLEKISWFTSSLRYAFKNLLFSAHFQSYENFTHLGPAATPEQLLQTVNYFQISLRKPFTFWKVTIDNELFWQTVEGTNRIHLPDFGARVSLFGTFEVFKKAATIQPGFDLYYNTGYDGNAYMPALRDFYLQYKKKTGNYPYADVFINLKLKRARFFVAYTHFNSSFSGRDYYMVPHYPMPDAAFRFGISWIFLD